MTNASLPLQIPPLFAARRSAPQLGPRAALASVDVLVRGDGIVACTLALLLARQGLQVGLVTARTWQTTPVAQAQQMDMTTAVPASSDVRAYLINTTSQQILAAIGQWTAAMDQQAVARMQVQADGVLHTLTLSAEQALGWIVDVPQLEQHLRLACVAEPQIQVLDAATAQNCTARLQVICEGKNSPSRNALGVHMQREYYPQTALAARVRCGLAHGFTARQWFIGDSIVALLPMTAHDGAAQELALVWSQPHAPVSYTHL